MNTARTTAVNLLIKTFEEKGYSNLLLDKALADAGLSQQEKAFCTQLYYGVTERLLTLEHLLRVYSNKPPEKLDIPVKYILYLGFYQMKYCDKIPDSAAVNESVWLAGYFRKKSASGLINAILRNFQRSGKAIPLTGEKWQDMQIQYSAPVPLLKRITEEHGEAFTKMFFEDSLRPPPCVIRVNPLKAEESVLQELHPEKLPFPEYAYRIQAADIRKSKAFQQGMFHMQDTASQFCCQLLAPEAGQTVLDVCAAPGGKSFTLAELMQNQGILYAFDLHPHRVRLIQKGAERLGLTCVHSRVQNAAQYQKGILVYSTCTVLKRENEEVVMKFLNTHPEFEPVPLKEFHSEKGWKTFSPEYADCDGFFAAKLRRKSG